ncbi:phosphoribosylformylglycinamidine synthase subunit PurQ [Ferrimicrobium sp.]|uniref:phosphoribosylformylglycinamidine synthase subunit PurQ n=1 Tax=Ferrimicrobium sp. TaxID=2926050 RepID=UPI002616D83F|nr:phosphoribosylformylglycinamidine synthase subunit PurQ [Ferrimicrobium sp.]
MIGIVVFPGSNCEFDVMSAYAELGCESQLVSHREHQLDDYEAVIIPGGFSYGDYLRTGAIARFSPIMETVTRYANEGGRVLGICNGFQVLTEAGLLPGALQRNAGLQFVCGEVLVRVEQTTSVLTSGMVRGEEFSLPINHFEGNYTADAKTLERLEAGGQVVLRYLDNPNGSANDIAGVANPEGNVVGLMPHPERAGLGFGLTAPARQMLASMLQSQFA